MWRHSRHQANIFTSPLLLSAIFRGIGHSSSEFQQDRGLSVAAALENLFLCATESSVADIPHPSELEMHNQDVNLPMLKVQLKMVRSLIWTFNAALPDCSLKEVTTLRTFHDILNATPSTKVMFDEVSHFLQIVHNILVTTLEQKGPYLCFGV